MARTDSVSGFFLTFLGLAFALIVLLQPGCGFGKRRSSSLASTSPSVVRANDGKSAVRIPTSWSTLEVGSGGDGGVLEVGNSEKSVWLMVTTTAKKDYADDVDLANCARTAIEYMQNHLEGPKPLGGPTNLTINGRAAIQYEFTGTLRSSRLKVHYIHTTIDGLEDFHQIAAWSSPSRIEENRKDIQDVTSSFVEIR